MKKAIKQVRKHYICLNKDDNSVILCYHKTTLAHHIGVNVITISRHLTNNSVYDTKEYCIWANVSLIKRSKGFRR